MAHESIVENNDEYLKNARKEKDSQKLQKILMTLVVYYSTFSLGVAVNYLGPAVLAFSKKYDTDVPAISITFTVLTASYVVGAFSGIFIYNYFQRQVGLIFFLCLMSVGLFAVPFVPSSSIILFYIIWGIFIGIGGGGYDTGQVSCIIDIWRGKAAVWILGQHFAFSLGTVVPPLVMSPFLVDVEEDDEFSTTPLSTTSKIYDDLVSSSSVGPLEKSNLTVPYLIAGFIVTLGVAMQLILYIKNRTRNSRATLSKNTDENSNEIVSENQEKSEAGDRGRPILLVILSCCFIGTYSGMEMTSMQFLSTFAVFMSDNELSEAGGAQVLSVLTIAYSVMRGVGIFVGLRVEPQFILVGNFIFMFAGNLILLLFGQNSVTMLWVGSAIYGVGLSTSFPAYYGFIEKYLYVTDTIAAVVTVSAGVTGAIYPLILGRLVEETPSVLIYINLFSMAVFVSAFATVFWHTRGMRMIKAA